jgi:hypothetical protein
MEDRESIRLISPQLRTFLLVSPAKRDMTIVTMLTAAGGRLRGDCSVKFILQSSATLAKTAKKFLLLEERGLSATYSPNQP